MIAMNTTQDAYASLTSLSDLETRLFSAPVAKVANTAAYLEHVVPVQRIRAANVRPFLPDPPQSSRRGLVESVLLRAS